MNICVSPAVKISLITARLESKAVYLAVLAGWGALLPMLPPGDDEQPCCVVLWQGLFVVLVSPLSSCLGVCAVPSSACSSQKDGFAERSKKLSHYCPRAKNNYNMSAATFYGKVVDQYQLTRRLFGQVRKSVAPPMPADTTARHIQQHCCKANEIRWNTITHESFAWVQRLANSDYSLKQQSSA